MNDKHPVNPLALLTLGRSGAKPVREQIDKDQA